MLTDKIALGIEKSQIIGNLFHLLQLNSEVIIKMKTRISVALRSPLEIRVTYEAAVYHKTHRPYFDPEKEAMLPKGTTNRIFNTKKKLILAEYANRMLQGFAATKRYKQLIVEASNILQYRGITEEQYRKLMDAAGGPLLIVPVYPGIPGEFYWELIYGIKRWWKR